MLVHEHGIIKIDPEYPLDKAAVLSCGGATGLGSVLNAAAVRPGSSVAVVGCGGVGLSAIQGAVIAGARRIIAVDTQPAKLELAKSLGATDCVDASAGDAVAQVVELTGGGVDYSFATAAVSAVSEQCLQMLRSGGLATVIGSGADNIHLSLGFLVIGERRIQGALMGSNLIRTDIPRYVEFDQQGRIDVAAMVDSHITLAEVNEGFAAMQEAAINGRKVIMFE
jgi:S-(hydroxymethyl)glutathione dehydrogenase/alcohol dehydrogenase